MLSTSKWFRSWMKRFLKKYICYKLNSKETKKSVAWECSGRRRLGCPFKIVTTKVEGSQDISILKMSDPFNSIHGSQF